MTKKLLQLLFLSLLPSMTASTSNPIFAMSYGFSEHSIAERIEFLNETGFDGIGAFVHNDKTLEDFRQTMQHTLIKAGSFRVYGVYMPLNNERPEALSIVQQVLGLGSSQHAPIWLSLQNAESTEADALAFVRSVCDLAAPYGTDVILYPHDRHYWLDAEESIAFNEKANRSNLFTSLHLPHELRAGNAHRLSEVVAAALPYTKLVTLSGANPSGNYATGSRDWSDVVQALGQSEFDVRSFHRLLIEGSYSGPIGYNNWKIPGNPEDHHREMVETLRSWQHP